MHHGQRLGGVLMKLHEKKHRLKNELNRGFNEFTCLFGALALAVAVSLSAEAQIAPGAPALLNTNATSDTGNDLVPQVATDGAGNWVAVWYSTENLGGTAGTEFDIFVATSTDNGATWTATALLNTNGNSDTGNDSGSHLATDGVGNWVAMWTSTENLGGTAGTDFDIFVATSADNGATWTAPALLNTNATSDTGTDRRPQVTTDGVGNWVAVWESGEDLGGTAGTDTDIFVATSANNGATWTAPALLNTNGASDTGLDEKPQVTTDGVGNWIVVWDSDENLGGTAGTDDDIFVATFVFPGGGGGGGGCLIASAAYGTPMKSQIDVLRQVRDTYLLNTAAGSAFVDAYYTLSPPLADFVAKHPAAAATVRVLLTPIIAVAGALWTLPLLAGTFFMVAVGYAIRRRRLALVKVNG